MIIGLTGGIACGKSLVSNAVARTGMKVIDADVLAREAVAPGSIACERIKEVFGSSVFDDSGDLNRKKLGSIVFSSVKDRRSLEAILHPLIIERIKTEIEKAQNLGEDLLVSAPLLIETNLVDFVDVVWVVRSDPKTIIRRLCERDKISETDAVKRIEAQMPLEEKLDYADFIIDNDGSVYELLEQTRATLELTRMTAAHDILVKGDVY